MTADFSLLLAGAALLLAANLLRLPTRVRMALIIAMLASLSMSSIPSSEFQLPGMIVIAKA
jgi:hypothetical protein